MWKREVLEIKTQQETTTRHWSKSYLFYYKTKIKQMPFSLTNNAIGRNVLGQGKFNINSGHGKRCLHTDVSHRNAVPSDTLHLWRISKNRKDFCFWQEEQMTCTAEPWFSSLSQLFSAVIQSRAGEAQEDWKDKERHAQGLLPGTTLTLPMPQLQ